MLDLLKKKWKNIHHGRRWLLLVSLTLLLFTVAAPTIAFVITKTEPLINRFISGLLPDGTLVIAKRVEHPFGPDYEIPEDISFEFLVNLGEEYADKTVETMRSGSVDIVEMQADAKGQLEISIKPNEVFRILEIVSDTEVSVQELCDEQLHPGFYVANEEDTKTVVIPKFGETRVEFVNMYDPEPADLTTLTVDGKKVLKGRAWEEGDSFSFLLSYKMTGESETDWMEIGEQTIVCEVNEKGKVVADSLKFSFTDVLQEELEDVLNAAGTYAFRVTETGGTIEGVTINDVVSYFDVIVGDEDMDGVLEIQDVYGIQNAVVTPTTSNSKFKVDVKMVNQYASPGSDAVTIHISKVLEDLSGQDLLPKGFTFELLDKNDCVIATSEPTSSAGDTSIRLVYNVENADHIYNYVLREVNSGQKINGMTYDDATYPLQVAVIDNEDGTVSAYIFDFDEEANTVLRTALKSGKDKSEVIADVATGSNAKKGTVTKQRILTEEMLPAGANQSYAAGFENTYKPKKAVLVIKGEKELEGPASRKLKEEEFLFELYETDEQFVIAEDAEPIASARNVADEEEGVFNVFSFDKLTYEQVGTHYYAVVENNSDQLGGIQYDPETFCVTVRVIDKNGKLKAKTEIMNSQGMESELKFVNRYVPNPFHLVVDGNKTLWGAELKRNMFMFRLHEADQEYAYAGDAIAKVKNDAEGMFSFKDLDVLSFDMETTAYFVVVEDDSVDMEGIKYDDKVYGIEVVVTDDQEGQMVAETRMVAIDEGITETAEEISFFNEYWEPQTSPSEESSTQESTEESTEESIQDGTTETDCTEESTAPGSSDGTTEAEPTEESSEPEGTEGTTAPEPTEESTESDSTEASTENKPTEESTRPTYSDDDDEEDDDAKSETIATNATNRTPDLSYTGPADVGPSASLEVEDDDEFILNVLPMTGDDSEIGMNTILAILSVIVIVLLILYKRYKESNDEE